MSDSLLFEQLTAREYEVLNLIAAGRSNQEIADRLVVARSTAKWHVRQLYNKMGVENRRQAIARARAAGLLTDTASLSTTIPKNNLPAQITPFIGRQIELAQLAHLLTDGEHRLITILGAGGMGKTRLALAAAEQQVSHFADGVYFVPLAPLTSPDDIVTTIAESLSFSFFGNEPPHQQLLDYLRERHLLLLLDNFEHLLEGAGLLTEILQAAPRVKVLATSREILGLYGETTYLLAGMQLTSREDDALQLFAESARRAQPSFVLDNTNLPIVTRICQLVGSLPLGIEVAAAWLRTLTLVEIAAELELGLGLLETRTHSLHSVFDRSWRLMTDKQQQAFIRLSVFRGGCTREAAEAVTGVNLRVLQNLVDKSLLWRTAGGRFEMHELLRQFADEHLLQTGEAEAVRQAHSTYYMQFTAERGEDIKGRRQQAGLQDIRADLENIRKGWLWAVDHRQYDTISWEALDSLVNYAEMAFSYPEVHALLGQTVTALHPSAGEVPHPVWDRAVARLERVNYFILIPNDHEQLEAILARARERGDEREMAYCLWVLGDWAVAINHKEAFLAYFEECLALWQSVGDAFYIAHTFVGLGLRSWGGDFKRSGDGLRQSVSIRREIGDRSNLCWSLLCLSRYMILLDDFGEAEDLLDEALAIQAEIGYASVYVLLLSQKAQLAFSRGELDSAARYLQTAQEFAGERVYSDSRSMMLALLSAIASVSGDYARGYALGQQAIAAFPLYVSYREIALQWGLALAHCGLENQTEARRSLRQALDSAAENTEMPIDQRLCLPLAAILRARANHPEHAAELLGLAYSAPKEGMGWMEKWQLLIDLRCNLEAKLGTEVYQAAFERGKSLDLDVVVAELIAELTDTD